MTAATSAAPDQAAAPDAGCVHVINSINWGRPYVCLHNVPVADAVARLRDWQARCGNDLLEVEMLTDAGETVPALDYPGVRA